MSGRRVLRVIIVDDEPLAREKLRLLLEREPGVTVVGECADGLRALDCVARVAADLLFLDVEMPGIDGFETLNRLPSTRPPRVVMVSADAGHFARSSDPRIVEVLLKPFHRGRLQEVLRAVEAFRSRDSGRRVEGLAEGSPTLSTPGA